MIQKLELSPETYPVFDKINELVDAVNKLETMTWQPIPRYSESRELAMRALEEYCKTINYKAVAINLVDYWQVFFFRGSIKDNLNADFTCGDTLPLAICQAIAKHHEGKDLK